MYIYIYIYVYILMYTFNIFTTTSIFYVQVFCENWKCIIIQSKLNLLYMKIKLFSLNCSFFISTIQDCFTSMYNF